jgi:hypothetical protein
LTQKKTKDAINKLKKKYKNFKSYHQIRPFVGGAIDLGIKKAKKKVYCNYGIRLRNKSL